MSTSVRNQLHAMTTSKIPRPPQQPVVLGEGGPRFLPNLLVVYIAEHGRVDVPRLLNDDGRFSDDDARHVQQLLGIRIFAYESLPYVHPNVLEPYREAEPSDHTPFEPRLALHMLSSGIGPQGFEVRTGPKDSDVRVFGPDLREASQYFGEAYVRWKERLDEQQDDGPPGAKQPMQPVVVTERGILRFRQNSIVYYLLDHGGIGLNQLAMQSFPREDWMQFAQLIGYSLSGYSELSYVTDESYEAACELAKRGGS